nr:hypothetical protein [Anaerolineae bacterium]
MKRMRLLIAVLVIWLFAFYNMERLSEPINITRVAYILVPFMAVLTILICRLRRVPLGVLLVGPIPIVLGLRAWLRYGIWGTAIPLTV